MLKQYRNLHFNHKTYQCFVNFLYIKNKQKITKSFNRKGMLSSVIKETPFKRRTPKESNNWLCKGDSETIDNSSLGQRSGKSSPDQQRKQMNNNKVSPCDNLQQVKQCLFVESNQTDSQQDDIDQLQILSEKDFELLLNQDLVNLRQLQWVIKAFNKKSNIIDQCASKVVNKVQKYFRSSGILKQRERSRFQFQEFLIVDDIAYNDDLTKQQSQQQQLSTRQQQQLTLIASQYLLRCRQSLVKFTSTSLSPYCQQYLQSILLVIDDFSTFKTLPNEDIKYQLIEIIQQIECNLNGKEQKKYARKIYRVMVNQMVKQQKIREDYKEG